ncbi:MAG TPA: hypothetical protein VHW44_19370 [Pseudonocardiaceae bacterium]|jgi:hypothetical protein|nr:hypothetical protein [Pseudonocardiaceae bacterium]
MLAGCTATLVAEGWHVVLPSRRHAPIPANEVRDGPPLPRTEQPRQALWVETDWSNPVDLTKRAGRALGGPAELLIAWVHEEHRETVLRAVEPLLAATAAVVEVHNIGEGGRLTGFPEPILRDHATQQVVLGYVRTGGRPRWLNQAEIADGVLAAVRRALAGRPSARHQVGAARSFAVRA